MKKTITIGIILMLSMLLVLSGCGGKESPEEEEPVPVESVPEPVVEEPELPDDAVSDFGEDVTGAEEPEAEEPEEPVAPEEISDVGTDVTDEEDEVNPLTADNYRVVSLKDLKAYPEEMRIEVGTTVEWRNVNDNLQHIIGWNGQRQMGVKPEPILKGESWSYTFMEPGDIKWFSTARPTIQGTIHIEEPAEE